MGQRWISPEIVPNGKKKKNPQPVLLYHSLVNQFWCIRIPTQTHMTGSTYYSHCRDTDRPTRTPCTISLVPFPAIISLADDSEYTSVRVKYRRSFPSEYLVGFTDAFVTWNYRVLRYPFFLFAQISKRNQSRFILDWGNQRRFSTTVCRS